MKFSTTVALACACAMTAAGCATITRGSSEDVQFISDPPGAQVKTSLGPSCITPCTLKFGRRDTFDATFTLDDQIETVFVDTEVAGGGVAGVAGNALVGGIIGIGVDVATGAGLNHVPNPVRVAFDAAPAEPSSPEAPVPSAAVSGTPAPVPSAAVSVTTAPAADTANTVERDGFRWESPPVGS